MRKCAEPRSGCCHVSKDAHCEKGAARPDAAAAKMAATSMGCSIEAWRQQWACNALTSGCKQAVRARLEQLRLAQVGPL